MANVKTPRRTVFVNFFGGPGVGKTTLAALTFAFLKIRNVEVDFVTEYAKYYVFSGQLDRLDDQMGLSRTQYHLLSSRKGKVDYVITDAPILQGEAYCYVNPNLLGDQRQIIEQIRTWHNDLQPSLNFFVYRSSHIPYETAGRIQKENEAVEVDGIIRAILGQQSVVVTMANPALPHAVASKIVDFISNTK